MALPDQTAFRRTANARSLVTRMFSLTSKTLTRLKGRSIEKFCKDEKDVPNYIVNFFSVDEKKLIRSNKWYEYEIKLLHKLLKTCCGLALPKHDMWSSDKEQDTFEYLITFCWNEYDQYLIEPSAITEDDLNNHTDKVLETLILLIEKLEVYKGQNLTNLKSEVRDVIWGKFKFYNNDLCSKHMYTILCEHSVHQMLVMVYKHLNHLDGMSLSKFLNVRKINLLPQTGFSNERKFLEGNPPPEKMPVRLLYQVVKHVCFNFELRRSNSRSDLEATLRNLKKEYITYANNREFNDKCYKVYGLLANALQSLSKINKEIKLSIGNLARETFVKESLQKPFELSDPSPSKKADSPEDSSTCSFTPCLALTSPTAKKDERTIEEVNDSVLFKVMCPGGLISDTLALVFKALKGDFATTQRNVYIFRFRFTSDEKKFINPLKGYSINEELSNKDVTLLCKLLRHGCDTLSRDVAAWSINNPASDTIEYNITVIRRERFKLAHEVSSIKAEDLNNTLDTIKNSLHIILEKTKSFLRYDELAIKKDIEKQQDKIEDEIPKISQISCTQSVNNIWTELDMSNKVKRAAHEESKQPHLYRENLLSMSPIIGSRDSRHKSLTIDAVFMDRELEDKNNVKAECTYRIEDILFSQKSDLSSFRVLIIPGRPGDGKTSICKYIFHLWSNDIHQSSLKGVDLLFYIPCRCVTIKGLTSNLINRFPNTFQNMKFEDVIPLLQEPQVLFVIDGYDEAGEEAKLLIHDILFNLPDCKMIITTKAQYTCKLIEKAKFNYKVLSLVQMTEEKRQQYVKKFFLAMNQDIEDCNDFLSYLDEMKENLSSIIDVPLTFSLLALLWIEEPGEAKKITTVTQLYHKLIGLILERVAKELHVSDSSLCRQWMITLGELAWNNLKNRKYDLSEKDQNALKKKATDLDLHLEGNSHLMSSLLHCEIHDSLVTDEKETYTFTSTSQQEYFAAEYIADKLKYDKNAYLLDILELSKEVDEKSKKKLRRLIPVIEMICGLLVIVDGINKIAKELTEIMSVKEPWSFIAMEKMFKHLMEENSRVEDQVKTMFKGEKMSIFHDHDPQSTLWVLKNTSLDVHQEVTVITTMSDVPQMLPLLDFLLSKSCLLKVIVRFNKVINTSELAKLSEKQRYKHVRFFFAAWEPLCISELIINWPFSSPLFLSFSLCPNLAPLVWWESLMCLLTMDKKVTKIACSPNNKKWFKFIKEAAIQLKAEVVTDYCLTPAEVVIIHV